MAVAEVAVADAVMPKVAEAVAEVEVAQGAEARLEMVPT